MNNRTNELTLYTQQDLVDMERGHATLVGIDSDGCVFDTMRVKQVEHFVPLIARFWKLEAHREALQECVEFVNLYSNTRGSNRFPALLRVFELLRGHPAVVATGELPTINLEPLRGYINSGLPLGNPSLQAEVERTGDAELAHLLAWSVAINDDIVARMRPVVPFKWALKALEAMSGQSDMLVVSQTPEAALVAEWELHKIRHYVSVIAGQELGTKAEHLRLAAGKHYAPSRILMIGDALGDRRAAREVGACFFPITPGAEEESWQRLTTEAYPRFLAGNYTAEYEREISAAFDAALPELPPWQR